MADKKDSVQKQQEKEQQIKEELQKKILLINQTKDNLEKLKISLENPPYKSEDEELKLEYTRLVQQQLAKQNQEKISDEVIQNLNYEQAVNLFEYINKTFEMISEKKNVEYHPNFVLKLHQHLIEVKGKAVILAVINKRTSLVKRVNNFSKQEIKQI